VGDVMIGRALRRKPYHCIKRRRRSLKADPRVLLARTDIELGFIVVGLSLLPMLISLFNLPHSLVVRYSSVIAALVLALWLALFAHRYRKATSATLPISAWLHLALALAVVLALVGNASGYLPEPQVGLYALALSYVLASKAQRPL
jgi:hypothetical protein